MELKERLKIYEGNKEYQAKFKYFRDGKFYPYADSLGKMTVGYGHLITKKEDFSGGLTEAEADALLDTDIAIAITAFEKLGLTVPSDWNDFLVLMIFQLGLAGVQKFEKMLAALRVQNYSQAVKQAKDSLWARQTPFRVLDMIGQLKNK